MSLMVTMFSKRLRQAREERGWSQQQLADRVGIARVTITMYEAGEREPDFETLTKLARALRVTTDYLLGRTDDPQPPATGPVSYAMDDSMAVPGAWPVGPTVKVPILGVIRAGEPLLAQENIEGYAEIPEEQARTGRFFFLRVQGDSMAPQIADGALVLVKMQPEVENGKIAVVMVNAEEATVKRVYKVGKQLVLKADNPAYPPIVAAPEEVRIIGPVVEVRFKPR